VTNPKLTIVPEDTTGLPSTPASLNSYVLLDASSIPTNLYTPVCSVCEKPLNFEFVSSDTLLVEPCMNCLMGDICE
jgi:hypothetical protein